jgi:hypothetical protein
MYFYIKGFKNIKNNPKKKFFFFLKDGNNTKQVFIVKPASHVPAFSTCACATRYGPKKLIE